MRALVYHGPGQKAWEEVPDPEITDDGDVIVRVDATTICGTDLHILRRRRARGAHGPDPRPRGRRDRRRDRRQRAPALPRRPGARLLHQRLRDAAGSAARDATGSALEGGGWVLGHRIDGTQAEYVRVPYADTSTFRIPDGVCDEEALMLADILPTGYEVGVLAGGVRPGDVVAVVGAGPVGLSAITCARLFSPSHIIAIDLSDARLKAAKEFGADVTVNNSTRGPARRHQGPDRAARRGRGHRGRRRPRHLRTGGEAGPARRPGREHRRARQARHAAPGRPVGQGHHHHHRPGGRLLHADPDAPGRHRPARRQPVRHPPLRHGRLRAGLRRLRAMPPTTARSRSS